MNDLIWFSIPGAIALYASYILFPTFGSAPAAVLVGAAPVSGFIIHQIYRTFFELRGGWESPRRPVIVFIQEAYGIPTSEKNSAFLIWETTIYSDQLPEAFREHNRRMWHYVMSFRSVWLAASLSCIALIVVQFLCGLPRPTTRFVLGFSYLELAFCWKGKLTYNSLSKQEVAAFQAHRNGFDTTRMLMQRSTPTVPESTSAAPLDAVET